MNDEDLADIIAEIFDGVTVLNSSFGPIYVRHFGQLELRRTFSKKQEYLEQAKKRGLMTHEETLNMLYEDEMWSKESEKIIEEKNSLIENLKKGLNKIPIPSKREQHKKLIKKEIDNLNKLENERTSLLGLTAEKYAQKKVNQEFFEYLLYEDRDFKRSVFSKLEYSDISKEKELNELQEKFFLRMSDDNISRAALCPFFSPYLSYCENVHDMYGKAIKNLSAFELKLLTYAKTFLNIFKNTQKEIPSHVAKDPEALLDFYEMQKDDSKRNRGKATQGDGGTTYFGANKQDIQQMKSDNENAVDLAQEIKKRGGTMNMKDFMDIHGV